MDFSPFNTVVKYCLQGMEKQAQNDNDAAKALFTQAWDEASNDFERFLSAYYLAGQQPDHSQSLQCLQNALQFAQQADTYATQSAMPSLYRRMAECCHALGQQAQADEYIKKAEAAQNIDFDKGPFYHGTKADLQIGDLLVAGGQSNYHAAVKMNHIYFTAALNGAALAAALAKGDQPERVYIVEPTGTYENDPNLTDKKFPGNPSRSYRSVAPLRIVGETNDWSRPDEALLLKYRQTLANNKGQIIN